MVFQSTQNQVVENSFLWRKRKLRSYQFRKKGLSLLPNLFTLGNAFFGFCALVFVAREALVAGAYSILIGGLMDMLDGRIARYTGCASTLGLQLDSLCDAISFCVAPAFFMYFWQLKGLGVIGFIVSAFFLLSGVFRLARFNVTNQAQSNYFFGVPTTIAACSLMVIFLNLENTILCRYHSWYLLIIVLLLSFLMISTLKFPMLKKLKKKWYALGILSAIAFLMIFGFMQVGFIMLSFYFMFAIIDNIRMAVISSFTSPISSALKKGS